MLSSVSGKGFVPLEGKDPGTGSGEGSSHSEGSVPLVGAVRGKGKEPVSVRSVEYPILTRFRLRRLLALLAYTRFTHAFDAMQSEAGVFLDLTYLQRVLELCLWEDAKTYILRILPYDCMGVGGRTLMNFLVYLMFMHTIARRHPMADELIAKFECSYRDPVVTGDGNYVKVMHTILSMRSEQVRPSVDWNLAGQKAAEIARDLITQAPEFSEFLRLPRRSSNLHNVVNVLPWGFRSRVTRRVKKAGRVPGSVIAKYFLSKGRLQCAGQGTSLSGLSADPSAWLRAAIDETLRAGTRTALHLEPAKYACNEGMDRKRLCSAVSQDFDIGNYPKHPR